MGSPRKRTGRRLGAPRKLDDAQVAVIIACCRLMDRVREECSVGALAKKYGVHPHTIQKIGIYGKGWREADKLTRCKGAMSEVRA
jgi:hypothetical protein